MTDIRNLYVESTTALNVSYQDHFPYTVHQIYEFYGQVFYLNLLCKNNVLFLFQIHHYIHQAMLGRHFSNLQTFLNTVPCRIFLSLILLLLTAKQRCFDLHTIFYNICPEIAEALYNLEISDLYPAVCRKKHHCNIFL